MTNYGEHYPRCAECPLLQKWQISRDTMTAAFEVSALSDNLKHVERRYLTEQDRVQIDVLYAQLLSDVNDGLLPVDDPRFHEAQKLYAEIEVVVKESSLKDQEDVAFIDSTSNFLASVSDLEVRQLAVSCPKGPLHIALLGFKAVHCRSRMRKLAINPPSPPLA